MNGAKATPPGTEPSAVEQEDFRRVVGGFCSGVTIVTAAHEDLPVGLTCQSFFSLSLEPPLVAFSPSLASTSYPAIRQAGRFAVNILSSEQEALALKFARSGTDKWSGVEWTRHVSGCPLLPGTVAAIVCDIDAEHETGDHYLVVGRVRHLVRGRSRRPLLFFNSRFASLAEDQ